MGESLDAAGTLALLDRVVIAIEENRGTLDEMDAAIGDGDHGTSLAKSCNAALHGTADQFSSESPEGPGAVFTSFGTHLLQNSRGASGPLYATLFLSLGESLGTDSRADVNQLARGFAAATDAVSRRGGAARGDATLLDALEPYAEELGRASERGDSLAEAMSAAARAAADGARATADMVPARGRARSWADRAVGHRDPGAESYSVMARAMSEAVGAR